jgi:hypothetical protein
MSLSVCERESTHQGSPFHQPPAHLAAAGSECITAKRLLLLMMRERRNFILIFPATPLQFTRPASSLLSSAHTLTHNAIRFHTGDKSMPCRCIHRRRRRRVARQNRRCFVCARTHNGLLGPNTVIRAQSLKFYAETAPRCELVLIAMRFTFSIAVNSTLIGARLSVKLHMRSTHSRFPHFRLSANRARRDFYGT